MHTVIIGGGVIGLATALELRRRGVEVTLIDKGDLGRECSWGNCGLICPSHVYPLAIPGAVTKVMKLMMSKDAPVAMPLRWNPRLWGFLTRFALRCNDRDAKQAALAKFSLLAKAESSWTEFFAAEGLDPEFERKGGLFIYRTQKGLDGLAGEAEELCRDFGQHWKKLDEKQLLELEPGIRPGSSVGAWVCEEDTHLRPDVLMKQMAAALVKRGVKILDKTEVRRLIREGGKIVAVETVQAGSISGDTFVLATGAWAPKLEEAVGARLDIQPGKGYSITMPQPKKGPVLPMIFNEDKVVVTPFKSGYRLGSTMEFAGYDDSFNDKRIGYIVRTAQRYLLEATAEPVQEKWWGWRPMTPDGLPFIGWAPASPNLFVNAGHNMEGLTLGAISGRLAAQAICGLSPEVDLAPFKLGRPM
ncbi:MAG: hypothetical protein RL095_3837 [Verrucomicrobiota bacterium]|jgi:D-amino-acid dehydrogenase